MPLKYRQNVERFSDKENFLRLFKGFKGDALESVRNLFISNPKTDEIMEMLEVRFRHSYRTKHC